MKRWNFFSEARIKIRTSLRPAPVARLGETEDSHESVRMHWTRVRACALSTLHGVLEQLSRNNCKAECSDTKQKNDIKVKIG